MLVDTHCHLNFEAFEEDFHEVIKRCLEKEMKLIVVGSQLENSRKAVDIAHQYDNVYAAIGLHPIHLGDEEYSDDFEELAQDSKVVAIGETGLDYYHLWADSKEEEELVKNQQKKLMLQLLDLAIKYQKPVILHCRDAYEDMLRILEEYPHIKELRAVVHCFMGSKKIAEEFLNFGFLLSFTGIITFTEDRKLLDLIRDLDLDKIMIETDAPYLTPAAYRSERCEPWQVEEVAKKIAELKGLTLYEVTKATSENAINFFNLS